MKDNEKFTMFIFGMHIILALILILKLIWS